MQEVLKKLTSDFEKCFQKTSVIILFEILFSVILLVFGWFWTTVSDNSVKTSAISLIWILIVLLTIASFILRRVLFNSDRLRKLSKTNNLLLVLQTHTIFLNFLGVVVAVFGFIISTLSGNKFELFKVGIIALIIFISNFPKKEIWVGMLQRIERG